MSIEPPYRPRFVHPQDMPELINLYHLARTALAGGDDGRVARMSWASKWFAKEHAYVSAMGAYKDLSNTLWDGL